MARRKSTPLPLRIALVWLILILAGLLLTQPGKAGARNGVVSSVAVESKAIVPPPMPAGEPEEEIQVDIPADAEPADLLARANALYHEGSFRLARAWYKALMEREGADAPLRNEAAVMYYDSLWRERGPGIEQAKQGLRRLMEDLPADSLLRARAAESLARLNLEFESWQFGEAQLEPWLVAIKIYGESAEVETARPRYVQLNLDLAERLLQVQILPVPGAPKLQELGILPPPPPENQPWRNDMVTWAARNVLKVAKDAETQAHAYVLLGRLHLEAWIPDQAEREKWQAEAEAYFKQALEIEPRTSWHDDALWMLATFYNQKGRFSEAAETAERLLQQHEQGESEFYERARGLRESILTPRIDPTVGQAYAPKSYIHLNISYRNVSEGHLRVERIEPKAFLEGRMRPDGLIEDPPPGTEVREQNIEGLVDKGDHVPGNQEIWLEPLEPGIYRIGVRSSQVKEQPRPAYVYVTALALATKQSGDANFAWVTEAETGRPVSGADVRFAWEIHVPSNGTSAAPRTRHEQVTATTDANGMAQATRPALRKDESYGSVFTLAVQDGHPAAVEAWSGYYDRGSGGQWPLLYAYTDRPAYRPGEPIQWKAILRYRTEKEWTLPERARAWVVVRDARQQVVYEGEHAFSDYGSLAGTLTVDRTAALGMMSLQLLEGQGGNMFAGAQLCRVEEYKLPEFKVNVEPPREQVKFGAEVPFEITGEYYFGGPVSGGEVEVVVHRQPFYPWWFPPRPYPWLWEDGGWGRRGAGLFRSEMFWPPFEPEEVVHTETLKLDAQGRARVVVAGLSEEDRKAAEERKIWGYSYRVEARVVDTSRREVTGQGTVKVARTAFAAYLTPKQYLYLPGDPVQIEIKTLDPNDRPVSSEARVTVFKRVWNATKVNDDETTGGYDDTELFTRTIRTDEEGMHVFEFESPETGVFLIKFAAQDMFGAEVEAETNVFVADRDTTQTGYRAGGVEIITDKDSYARGETAQVLLIVRRAGAPVWFAVESEGIHEQRMVAMEGTSQLVTVPMTQEHEPNVYFTALSMFDYSAFQTNKRIVVPPLRRFLNVEIETGAGDLRPGQTTSLRVRATDEKGGPVRAEISLGVADQAVWAIQDDLVGDIRQAFWSETRGLTVQTQASPSQYTIEYWQPKPGKPGEYEHKMREDIPEEARREARAMGGDAFFAGSMVKGDVMAVSEMAARPTAAPAMEGVAMDAKGEKERMAAAVPPRMRTDFSSTALWLSQVVTDADGYASATLTMPDSLTTWNVTSKAIDRETRVGEQGTTVVTNKPIMIRPQGPRFFVEGDEATVSAVVNNETTASQQIHVMIDAQGLTLQEIVRGLPSTPASAMEESLEPVRLSYREADILVPAGGQRRIDWTVTANQPGSATITMQALNPLDSDAVEKTYPVLEYGIEQFIAQATSIRDGVTTDSAALPGVIETTMQLNVPAERREGSEGLTIWIEPTLARAMVNALPYLAQYPYGCVEQTLSRFVPAVITQRVVSQLGLSLPELEAKLPDMIRVGLERLYDAQREDGGWGWWPESRGDLYMTAYVVQGLGQARAAGVDVDADVLRRGAEYLLNHVVEVQQQHDLVAFVLYAVASADVAAGNAHLAGPAYDRLWPERQELNAYSRALFTLACHLTGRAEWAETLTRNMYNDIHWDKDNGTAYWGKSGFYWRWSDGPIEATAFSLRALLAVQPNHELVDPAMTWLVRNRRGNRWKNTRDTAIVISALADYVLERGENRPDWTAEVLVNGEPVGEFTATAENVFAFEGQVVVDPALLRTGENTVTIRRRGTGALYASAWLTYFTREKPIPPAANEIEVERQYFRVTQQETAAGEYKEAREPIEPGAALVSGDRVEVELRLDAKNIYEYIVIEDLKAAGLEPVEVQSGWTWGEGLSAHRELRDEKTAFFVDQMPEGKHTLKYTLRAEVPGVFQALPTLVHAMYVPEIRANSASAVLKVEDAPAEE